MVYCGLIDQGGSGSGTGGTFLDGVVEGDGGALGLDGNCNGSSTWQRIKFGQQSNRTTTRRRRAVILF